MNSLLHFFKQFVAIVFIGFGVFMLLVFGLFSIFNADIIVHNLILFFVLVILPISIGALSLSVRYVRKKREDTERLELDIVQYAQLKQGVLSVPELCVYLKIKPTKGRDIMRELTENGLFEVRLTDDGAMVYKLIGYASDKNKYASHSII